MEIEVINTYPNGVFTIAQQKILASAISKILNNANIENTKYNGDDNNKYQLNCL